MPISLNEARKNSRPIEVEFMGQKATVDYRPTEFTGTAGVELSARLDGQSQAQQAAAGARFLCKVLRKWDVLGTNDKPVPFEEKAIMDEVPIPLIIAVFQAIQADMAPNPPS